MNTQLRKLIRNLIDGADNEGCSDDLTVVNSADVMALKDYLEIQPVRSARPLRPSAPAPSAPAPSVCPIWPFVWPSSD